MKSTKLYLNQLAIEKAACDNMSSPGCETYLRSDTGATVVMDGMGNQWPSVNLPEGVELIPIPALDPEGHGLETERFGEFSENPPSELDILSYSDAYNELDAIFDRDDYIAYAKALGWASIEADWEASESEALSFIISEWVEGLETGSLDSLNKLEGLNSCYQVIWG